jgi:hypothetical protein
MVLKTYRTAAMFLSTAYAMNAGILGERTQYTLLTDKRSFARLEKLDKTLDALASPHAKTSKKYWSTSHMYGELVRWSTTRRQTYLISLLDEQETYTEAHTPCSLPAIPLFERKRGRRQDTAA